MSATERAVIYVDSGSDLSGLSSPNCSPSPPGPTSSSSRRGALVRLGSSDANSSGVTGDLGSACIMLPHSDIRSTGNGTGNGNNFVIKIQIGEESTLFNPVRIDVATTGGSRFQTRHVTTTTTTTSSDMAINSNKCVGNLTSGKSIFIAAASATAVGSAGTGSSSSSSVEGDLSSAVSSSGSGQSSPRSDMTPPIITKRPLLRFGSETSESDTESDISSLTDYHTSSSASPPLHQQQQQQFRGSNMHRVTSNVIAAPAAQYVMREILGMSVDSTKKTKLIEEQTKFVQLKNNVHKSLMKTFSGQGNGTLLKPVGKSSSSSSSSSASDKRESLNEEIKKAFQQRNARNLNYQLDNETNEPAGIKYTSTALLVEGTGNKAETQKQVIDSMADVMRITKSNNKIVSFTSDSDSIILDQEYFHLNEFNNQKNKLLLPNSIQNGNGKNKVETECQTLTRNFAGFKDIFARTNLGPQQDQIMSDNGTIRGVKNRVRDGIATFLQNKDVKSFNEKERGRLVVYVTSMGVVRDTFQRCQKVKQILRNLLVKFDERDCYMNRAVQDEIRERLEHNQNNRNSPFNNNHNNNNCNYYKKSDTCSSSTFISSPSSVQNINTSSSKLQSQQQQQREMQSSSSSSTNNKNQNQRQKITSASNHLPINSISLPQVFLEGQHLGDADTIEKLNETGQLRDLLRPFKSLSVLSTCDRCGGFRMLPCPVCNGSKKSVHRNHFTAEFIALKCMHCDPVGLVRCENCNPDEGCKGKIN